MDLRAGDGTSQSGVELTWTDPQYTYGDEPGFTYEGVQIERATDPAGIWEIVDTVPAGTITFLDTTAASFSAGQRLYYRLRTVRNGQTGLPGVSDVGYVDFPPELTLEVPLSAGAAWRAPAEVEFNALGSADPDGGSLTYEWDWDNTGEWESTGISPIGVHTFFGSPDDSPHPFKLRVTDEEGSQAEQEFSLPIIGNVRYWMLPDGDNEIGSMATQPDGTTVVNYRTGELASFDKFGALQWTRDWGFGETYGEIFCGDLLYPAPDGDFFVCTRDSISRFNSLGEPLWSYKIDPGFGLVFRNPEMSTTPEGDLWLFGTDEDYWENNWHARVLKVSATGDLLLDKYLIAPGTDVCAINNGLGVSADNAGGALLQFNQYSGLAWNQKKAVAMRLDSVGGILWQKELQIPGSVTSADRCLWLPETYYTEERFVCTFLVSGNGLAGEGFALLDLNGTLVNHWRAYINQILNLTYTTTPSGAINLLSTSWSFQDLSDTYLVNDIVNSHVVRWDRSSGYGTAAISQGLPGYQTQVLAGGVDPNASWERSERLIEQDFDLQLIDAQCTLEDVGSTWTVNQLVEEPAPQLIEDPEGIGIIRFRMF